MIAPWAHEILTFASLAAAGAWLVVQLGRISTPSSRTPGCARCEHNPVAATPVSSQGPGRGVRSKQLRVIP